VYGYTFKFVTMPYLKGLGVRVGPEREGGAGEALWETGRAW
jgi:hypothetical protein